MEIRPIGSQASISTPPSFYELLSYDSWDMERHGRRIPYRALEGVTAVLDNYALRKNQTQLHLSGPVRVLHKILTVWQLDGQSQKVALLLGFDETDRAHARNILVGRVALKGRDIEDRVVCLYQIRKTLHALLRNEKTENEWLRKRHDGLDGHRPMELMLKGSMENLLLIRDYVEAIAGL